MRDSFKEDYLRMTGTKYKTSIRSFVQMRFSPQIRFMRLWRKANRKMTIMRRLRLLSFARRFGLEISPKASIGKGCYLGHAYNITVAPDVILGDNVNLHKGCTIGRENRGLRKGTPTIGSCVSVGINATVVGRITIGDDVMIAPNSFVNFDVPSHSVVVGSPGIIHHRDNATEGYIAYKV